MQLIDLRPKRVGADLRGVCQLGSNVNYAKWFADNFTGVPVEYSANPISLQNIMMRVFIPVAGGYNVYLEETSAGKWYIKKAFSSNGLQVSTPGSALLALGAGGEFDEWGQADPTVIDNGGGSMDMWYDALNGSNVWDKLGYATSSDYGETWTKYGAIISRGASGAWDDNFIHHPCVIKEGSTYYMFYAGAKATSASRYQIGLATSTDKINWTKVGTAPVIEAGTGSDFDKLYVRPSNPIKIYDLWYMWYWGVFDASTHAIGLATSPDLITWTKHGRVLEGGASVSFPILKTGTNPKDRIVQLWYTPEPSHQMRFANITIPNALTKLSGFNKYQKDFYGDNTLGTASNSYAANYIYFARITVASEITATTLRAFFGANLPTSGTVKMAIYANGTNTPTTLLAVSEERRWKGCELTVSNAFKLTTNPVLAAGDYWIGIWSTVVYKRTKAGATPNTWGWQSIAYGASFPNPAVAGSIVAGGDSDVYLTNEPETVYTIALLTEPTKVYYNNVLGNKKNSISEMAAEYDWFWSANTLYVYSDQHPDIRYQIYYE